MTTDLSGRPGSSLYDSFTRTQGPFQPLTPGQVGIYGVGGARRTPAADQERVDA